MLDKMSKGNPSNNLGGARTTRAMAPEKSPNLIKAINGEAQISQAGLTGVSTVEGTINSSSSRTGGRTIRNVEVMLTNSNSNNSSHRSNQNIMRLAREVDTHITRTVEGTSTTPIMVGIHVTS